MSPPESQSTASQVPHPDAWASFRQALVQFDPAQLNLALGLRGTFAVTLPLVLGMALGRPLPALVAATGALNVAFADGSDPYRARLRRMLVTAVLVACAVFCGSTLAETLPGALAAVALWAFAAGMSMALGTPVGNVGVCTLCVLIVFGARPMPPGEAALAGLLALGGGLITTAVGLLFRPRPGREAERRALAALYRELADLPARPVQAGQPPPAGMLANQAREAMDALAGARGVQIERYHVLLAQAERCRATLLTLRSLRERAREGPAAPSLAPILDDFLAAAGGALRRIAEILATARPIPAESHPAAEAEAILERFRARSSASPAAALEADAQAQMDALTRQLRVTFDVASHATPAGSLDFDRRQAVQPWRLRIGSAAATLRANLNLRSAVFRHALRLAVCIAAGDAFGRALAARQYWARPYWLPLTIAVVLRPDFAATFSRGVLRLAGTFAGLGLATVLFHLLPQRLPVEIALVAAFTFVLRWAGRTNYGLLAAAVSALVVLLVAVTGIAPAGVIVARAENTAIGGLFALAAYWLWPTWERTQIGETFARMLDAYRRYWVLLGRAYAGTSDGPGAADTTLDRARTEARLARSNLEASVDRLAAEPGATRAQMRRWHTLLASAHLFAHSAIMLEANRFAPAAPPVPPGAGEALQAFFRGVAETFALLAAALRGEPAAGEFPDLREAHHRLVREGGTEAARHTLLNVETDKIVNSLNTLREQLCPRPRA